MFTETELSNIAENGSKLIQSEIDDNFNTRKMRSMFLGDSLERIAFKYLEHETPEQDKMLKKGKRVKGCGAYLEYRIDPNRLNDPDYQRLTLAFFCGHFLCPLCQWRKSRKVSNQLTAIISKLAGYRFIFLTLTVANVTARELQPAVNALSGEAWKRLVNGRRFKQSIKGYFRSFEVTHDAKQYITKEMYARKRVYYNRHGLKIGDANPVFDTYHPHIHVLLAVEPCYFDKANDLYISQKEWRELWQRACNLDYDPYVDVRAVYNKDSEGAAGHGKPKDISSIGAVLEIAKYVTKSSDYLLTTDEDATDAAVYAISEALAGKRLVSLGGVFRKAHKELHLDSLDCDSDLLHVENHIKEGLDDFITYICTWRGKSGYVVDVDYDE